MSISRFPRSVPSQPLGFKQSYPGTGQKERFCADGEHVSDSYHIEERALQHQKMHAQEANHIIDEHTAGTDDDDVDDDSEFDDYDEPEQGCAVDAEADDGIYDMPEECTGQVNAPPAVSRSTKPKSQGSNHNSDGDNGYRSFAVDHQAQTAVDSAPVVEQGSGIIAKLQYMLESESFRKSRVQGGSAQSNDHYDESELYEVPGDAKAVSEAVPMIAEPKLDTVKPKPPVAPKKSVKGAPPLTKPKPKPTVKRKPTPPQPCSATETSPAQPIESPPVAAAIDPLDSVPVIAANHEEALPQNADDLVPTQATDEELYLVACDHSEDSIYEVSGLEDEEDMQTENRQDDATQVAPDPTPGYGSLPANAVVKYQMERSAPQVKPSASLPRKFKQRLVQFGNKMTGNKFSNDNSGRPRNISDPAGSNYEVSDEDTVIRSKSFDKTRSLQPSNNDDTNEIYQVADEDDVERVQPLYEVNDDLTRSERLSPREVHGSGSRVAAASSGQSNGSQQANGYPPALPERTKKSSDPQRKKLSDPGIGTEKRELVAFASLPPKLPSRAPHLTEVDAEASDEEYILPDGKEQGKGVQGLGRTLQGKTAPRAPVPPQPHAFNRDLDTPEPAASDDESYLLLQEGFPLTENEMTPYCLESTAPLSNPNTVTRQPMPKPAGIKQATTREKMSLPSRDAYHDCEPIVDIETLKEASNFNFSSSKLNDNLDNETRLATSPWYFGNISRDVAERKLNNISRDGCFLVRDASKGPGFSLSLWYNQSIRHLRIPFDDRTKKYNLGSSNIMFDSVFALVEYFRNFAIDLKMGGSCPLKTPCPK